MEKYYYLLKFMTECAEKFEELSYLNIKCNYSGDQNLKARGEELYDQVYELACVVTGLVEEEGNLPNHVVAQHPKVLYWHSEAVKYLNGRQPLSLN